MDIKLKVQGNIITRLDDTIICDDDETFVNLIFTFSEEWNNKKINAVISNGITKIIEIVDNQCEIPWELITKGQISVYTYTAGLCTTNKANIKVEYIKPVDFDRDLEAAIKEVNNNLGKKIDVVNTELSEQSEKIVELDGNFEKLYAIKQTENLYNDSSKIKMLNVGSDKNFVASSKMTCVSIEVDGLTHDTLTIERLATSRFNVYQCEDEPDVGTLFQKTYGFANENKATITLLNNTRYILIQMYLSTETYPYTLDELLASLCIYYGLEKVTERILVTEKLEQRINALENKTSDNGLKLLKFGHKEIGRTSRELLIDGRYAYVGFFNGLLKKYDIGIETDITEVWSKQIGGDNNNVNGLACDENYLYAVDRDYKAWTERSDTYIGKFYVIDKSNGNVLESIDLSGKGSGIILYKDKYAIVSMQVYGWCIFDISDVENITKVYEYLNPYEGAMEFQKMHIMTINKIDYLGFSNFGYGFQMWDITNISAPTKSHAFNFKEMLGLGSIEQCFDFIRVDNYLYLTVAPQSAHLTDTTRHRGIIKLDLTDLSKMDNLEYDYYGIGLEDWASVYGESDTNPNAIVKIGNYLLINNAGKGIAIFEINSDYSLTYVECRKLFDGVIRPMEYTQDGRFIVAPDNTKGKEFAMCIFRPI